MIDTKDEILIKFASMFGDKPEIDPTRFPETTRLLEEENIDTDQSVSTPDVLNFMDPEQEKPPMSKRDFKDPFEDRGLVPGTYDGAAWPWEDPHPSSVEWAAQHYTQEYLKGVDMPYRGYSRDPQNDYITKVTMDRMISIEPEKYFEWGLRRRQELKPWMVPAAKALIDRDPYTALMKGIYNQGEEVKHLLPKLWKDVMEAEFKRASETESGQVFIGILFNRMRSLAGEIARTNPGFYIDEIAESGIGKKFRTKQFDSWATNALRDR